MKSIKQDSKWLDYRLSNFRWYRKYRGGTWYRHAFTKDASELTFSEGNEFWARYPDINRYSKVLYFEVYQTK